MCLDVQIIFTQPNFGHKIPAVLSIMAKMLTQTLNNFLHVQIVFEFLPTYHSFQIFVQASLLIISPISSILVAD